MGKYKNILITGADGFIGSHLTEMLVKKGYVVKALAQYNSFNNWGWLEEIDNKDQVEVVTGDIRDPYFCKEITKDIHIVFHLAALVGIPYSYIAPDSYLDTVSAAAADAFTFEGQRVGLPLQVSQVAWWYNKDLMSQAGIDVSQIKMWDDLLDAVKQIKAAGITPICMGGKDKWPVHFVWTHLHIRNGGKGLFLESLNNGGWDRPEYIRSGEQMLELVELEPFQKGWLAATWPDQAGFFGDGKCAMAFMGNWMYGAQASNSASGEGLADANMGMFNMPITSGGIGDSGDTLGGINGWLFSSTASDAAVELMMHYVSLDIQKEDASNGAYIPIVKGADGSLTNPFLQQVAKNISNSEYHQIFYDQFLGADIGRVVNDVSTDLAAGIISAEEATQAVQEAWEFNQ